MSHFLLTAGRHVARAFVCWVPLLLPLVCLAVILPLQPSDHLGPPAGAAWLHVAIYDDLDCTAFAVRALNAEQGRLAGRIDEPAESLDDFSRRLGEPNLPLEPRYWLEYPHAALLLFRLGFLWQPHAPPPPPAVLDTWHPNIVQHEPTDAELPLYRRLRRATRTYSCLMAVCLMALVLVLRWGYGVKGLTSAGLILALPSALYFSLYRFDIVPALLTALGLACLGRRWWSASSVCMAAAAMIKVYPVLLVPLVLRFLDDWRIAARWLLVYAATAAAFILPTLLHEDLEALAGPYRVQLGRVLEQGEPRTVYGWFLPLSLAQADWPGKAFRHGVLLLTLAALLWRRVPNLASLLRRSAILLIVFVSLAVFYSPQWLLWLAPLLLPLTRQTRGLAWLLVALDLATYCTFPLPLPGRVLIPLAMLRYVVLAGIVALLLFRENEENAEAGAEQPVANLASGAC